MGTKHGNAIQRLTNELSEAKQKLAAETARADLAEIKYCELLDTLASAEAAQSSLEYENAELKRVIAEAEKQEPFAWAEFDGEQSYYLRLYEDNQNFKEKWEARNPNHKGWITPLYGAPIPAQRSEQPAQAALTRAEIQREFDLFFEFDTDDRSAVTSASCRFFAEHVAKLSVQPAQSVAVVPEKLSIGAGGSRYDEAYEDGWNMCIDTMLGRKRKGNKQ